MFSTILYLLTCLQVTRIILAPIRLLRNTRKYLHKIYSGMSKYVQNSFKFFKSLSSNVKNNSMATISICLKAPLNLLYCRAWCWQPWVSTHRPAWSWSFQLAGQEGDSQPGEGQHWAADREQGQGGCPAAIAQLLHCGPDILPHSSFWAAYLTYILGFRCEIVDKISFLTLGMRKMKMSSIFPFWLHLYDVNPFICLLILTSEL